ncbi:hypothetical protein H5410_031697 [Solanum commersonii]|uniref:Uncharacterized protein n=1 Tax=Solanum commersonii TaxID=4109 RepID=A0A9J5YKP8_SOLCO|nr:hypothetical protein H5410_031697 [Solanum commersonii]
MLMLYYFCYHTHEMTHDLMTVLGVLRIHLSPGHISTGVLNPTIHLQHMLLAYYYVALWHTILSYTEKEHVSLSRTNERNNKKSKSFFTSEGVQLFNQRYVPAIFPSDIIFSLLKLIIQLDSGQSGLWNTSEVAR